MKKTFIKQPLLALAASVFLAGGVFLVGSVTSDAQVKNVKKQTTKQTIKQKVKKENDRAAYEADADLLKELSAQISIVESKKDWANFNRQRPIINSGGGRSAYIAQFKIEPDGEALIDVIVVHDSGADKFYEIRGFDFPRPFENLQWTNADVLQFDQWVNPRNGGRYRVNLKTGKIISAGYLKSI